MIPGTLSDVIGFAVIAAICALQWMLGRKGTPKGNATKDETNDVVEDFDDLEPAN